jgi:hypothetical protein
LCWRRRSTRATRPAPAVRSGGSAHARCCSPQASRRLGGARGETRPCEISRLLVSPCGTRSHGTLPAWRFLAVTRSTASIGLRERLLAADCDAVVALCVCRLVALFTSRDVVLPGGRHMHANARSPVRAFIGPSSRTLLCKNAQSRPGPGPAHYPCPRGEILAADARCALGLSCATQRARTRPAESCIEYHRLMSVRPAAEWHGKENPCHLLGHRN